MAMDYLTLGPTPAEETCAKLGEPGYQAKARKEGLAYINQLKRMFPAAAAKVTLKVKAHPHDFGTYYEVAAVYSDRAGEEAALEIEHHLPAEWDAEARTELGLETLHPDD